jgi:hypothetical protein
MLQAMLTAHTHAWGLGAEIDLSATHCSRSYDSVRFETAFLTPPYGVGPSKYVLNRVLHPVHNVAIATAMIRRILSPEFRGSGLFLGRCDASRRIIDADSPEFAEGPQEMLSWKGQPAVAIRGDLRRATGTISTPSANRALTRRSTCEQRREWRP